MYFDPEWYLAAYPDLADEKNNPMRHYMRHGRYETRLPCNPLAAKLEQKLWRGEAETALPKLQHMSEKSAGAEQVWAAWACARWAACQNDWSTAEAFLQTLDPERDVVNAFQLPSLVFLAIETALVAQNTKRAQAIYKKAVPAFRHHSPLRLAAANIQAAQQDYGPRWMWHIALLYGRRGLPGLRVKNSDQNTCAFDRLQTRRGMSFYAPQTSGPLVSVIMPAYNAEATIGTALRSLCSQRWQSLEILVVDNGSTDNTVRLIKKWCKQDPRIRLLDGSAQRGAYPARNIGLAAARGAFITVHDADDWSHAHKIEKQVRALQNLPSAMASTSHWVRATNDLRFTNCLTDVPLIHMNISSLMFRREVFETLGYWDRVRMAGDSEYYQRILQAYGKDAIINACPKVPLSLGRQTQNSLTQNPQTGMMSQFHGIRFQYQTAFEKWHLETTDKAGLFMPMHPRNRLFKIPEKVRSDV